MTFPNEVFWVFGVFNNSIRHQQHANYKYYNMFGIDAPPTPQNPAVPGYLLPIVIALATISTFSLIKKQKNKLKQFKVKY